MDTVIGSYSGGVERDVDNSADWYPLKSGDTEDLDGVTGAISNYDVSMAVSGALWDYFNLEGTDGLDVVQIAVDDLPSGFGMLDLRTEMESAADACYTTSGGVYCCTGSGCANKVKTSFDDHSIDEDTDDMTDEYYDPNNPKRGVDFTSNVEDDEIVLPIVFKAEAYPNPFNGQVTFVIGIPESGDYEFKIFDILGRVVHAEIGQAETPGIQKLRWTPQQHAANGVYLYQLRHAGQVLSGNISYVK